MGMSKPAKPPPGKFRDILGKSGTFLGKTGPSCEKWDRTAKNGTGLEKRGPVCGNGDILEKRGRERIFGSVMTLSLVSLQSSR